MDFDAYMVRDEADDTFAIGGRERFAGVGKTFGEAINPDAAVRI